jgi:hypothetical protein
LPFQSQYQHYFPESWPLFLTIFIPDPEPNPDPEPQPQGIRVPVPLWQKVTVPAVSIQVPEHWLTVTYAIS